GVAILIENGGYRSPVIEEYSLLAVEIPDRRNRIVRRQDIFDDRLGEAALIDAARTRLIVRLSNSVTPGRIGLVVQVVDVANGFLNLALLHRVQDPLRKARHILYVEGIGQSGDDALLHRFVDALLRRVDDQEMAHLMD